MEAIYTKVEGSSGVMLDVINAILEEPGGMIVADLMACEGSVTSQLKVGTKVYVDVVKREIKNFDKDKDKFVLMDALEFLRYTGKVYSAMICLDGIEHLEKEKGLAMLELMKEKSGRQIIFTPLGDYLVEEIKTDNPDSHKSGWIPLEFQRMGWATITFPQFHPTLNSGAFFAFNCDDLENEFARVVNKLNQNGWTGFVI